MIDWRTLTSDDAYNRLAKQLRKAVASLRDRAFIATLARWHDVFCERPITMVEVGVKQALFTREVLLACPFVEKMYAVDRWLEYPQDHPDRKQFGYARRPQASWADLERKARAVLAPFGDRASIVKEESAVAAGLLPAGNDVVFLDAGHSYEDVTNDCYNWWDTIRSGGLLCADDYFPRGHPGRDKTGVSQALEDFAASCGLPYFGHHRTFYMEVP